VEIHQIPTERVPGIMGSIKVLWRSGVRCVSFWSLEGVEKCGRRGRLARDLEHGDGDDEVGRAASQSQSQRLLSLQNLETVGRLLLHACLRCHSPVVL